MAQSALFTKIRVFVNGSLVFREASVKMTSHSGLIPTMDVNSGFAGVTQGAAFVTASVEQIVPADGPKLLTEGFQVNATLISFTIMTNTGSSFTTDGFVLTSDISHSVNGETKYSFDFQGEPAQWQVVA